MGAGTGGDLLGLAFVFLQNDEPFQFSPVCQAETQPHSQQLLHTQGTKNTSIPTRTCTPTTFSFSFSRLVKVFQRTKTEGGFAAPALAGRFTHEQMICNKYSAR